MPSRSYLKETKCSLLWRKVQSYCLQERKNGFKQTGKSFRALKFVKGLGFKYQEVQEQNCFFLTDGCFLALRLA